MSLFFDSVPSAYINFCDITDFVVPVDSQFNGTNIATDETQDITILKLERNSINCCVILEGVTDAVRVNAQLIEQIIYANEKAFTDEMSIEEKMRLLLCGELTSVQYNILKAVFSDATFNHYMLALTTENNYMQRQIKNFLTHLADKNNDYVITMDDRTIVFFRREDEEREYCSINEFASVLYENIKEELRVELVISLGGTITSFQELAQSYEKVVFAYKFGKLLSPRTNIYSYKDYVLLRLLSEVPKPLLTRYLNSLLEKNVADVLADEEIMYTAEEFMRNSLNISETSRKMVYHRNTLIHRLDKIEQDSGLNLRVFDDAFTFRLIKILNTLLKGDN